MAATEPSPPPVSPALDFFAGTVAGVASLVTGHPWDTVKVRLQTQPTASAAPIRSSGDERYYRNAWHAFGRILKEEKLSGLYKGVTSPMLGVAAINASVFTSYKFTMNSLLSSPSAEPTLAQITLSGSASGVFTSLITTPIERLKILQQSSSVGSSLSSPSTFSLLRTLPHRELYRGFTATLLRDTAYGPYFLVYEYVVRSGGTVDGGGLGKEKGAEGERHVKADLAEEVESELFGSPEGQPAASVMRVLVAGGLAGIAGWGATFPVDVVKTKMQSVPYPSSSLPPSPSSPSPSISSPVQPPRATAPPHPYSNLRSAFVSTYRESGWRGFVAGLGPTLLRSVPVNMVTFAVFELVISTFR
ncbi:hypothetical protein JCM8547_003580 [Rhodosporidiobolus lusitaniae]